MQALPFSLLGPTVFVASIALNTGSAHACKELRAEYAFQDAEHVLVGYPTSKRSKDYKRGQITYTFRIVDTLKGKLKGDIEFVELNPGCGGVSRAFYDIGVYHLVFLVSIKGKLIFSHRFTAKNLGPDKTQAKERARSLVKVRARQS
jgi:hypothetical protein